MRGKPMIEDAVTFHSNYWPKFLILRRLSYKNKACVPICVLDTYFATYNVNDDHVWLENLCRFFEAMGK